MHRKVTLHMDGLVLASDLEIGSLGMLNLFLLFCRTAHSSALLPLNKLHEVASLLLSHLFIVNLLEPLSSKDDNLVSILRYLGNGVVCQI